MTSPVMRRACRAVIRGRVPLVNRLTYGTLRYSANAFSNSLWKLPLLVIHLLSQIFFNSAVKSSRFGRSGDVTVINLLSISRNLYSSLFKFLLYIVSHRVSKPLRLLLLLYLLNYSYRSYDYIVNSHLYYHTPSEPPIF